LSKLLSC